MPSRNCGGRVFSFNILCPLNFGVRATLSSWRMPGHSNGRLSFSNRGIIQGRIFISRSGCSGCYSGATDACVGWILVSVISLIFYFSVLRIFLNLRPIIIYRLRCTSTFHNVSLRLLFRSSLACLVRPLICFRAHSNSLKLVHGSLHRTRIHILRRISKFILPF